MIRKKEGTAPTAVAQDIFKGSVLEEQGIASMVIQSIKSRLRCMKQVRGIFSTLAPGRTGGTIHDISIRPDCRSKFISKSTILAERRPITDQRQESESGTDGL
jgi:hypothetical protein